MKTLLGLLAGCIAFASFIPYFISIFKGETTPQRSTFAIWSAMNVVMVASYFAAGARQTIWMPLVYAVLQIAVLGLSFRFGSGKLEKLDFACLAGGAIGIAAWITTKNPAAALFIGIGVEFLGWLPLVKKVYLHPQTENTFAWVLAGVAALLNVAALSSWQPEIALYPLFLVMSEGTLALLLLLPRWRLHTRKKEPRFPAWRVPGES